MNLNTKNSPNEWAIKLIWRHKNEVTNAYIDPLILPKPYKFLSISSSMSQSTVTIPKKEYELLLEEVGILRDKDMVDAIVDSEKAKKAGVKTWELKF